MTMKTISVGAESQEEKSKNNDKGDSKYGSTLGSPIKC